MIWPTASQIPGPKFQPGLARLSFFGIYGRGLIRNIPCAWSYLQSNVMCVKFPHWARMWSTVQTLLLWEEVCSSRGAYTYDKN